MKTVTITRLLQPPKQESSVCLNQTHSRTSMLNSELISPRYSPIFSLLSPPCSFRNLATDLGSLSIKVCEMRYSIPRLGFLEERKDGGREGGREEGRGREGGRGREEGREGEEGR